MQEIKSIHDIKNGWLVVTRDEQRYIKIDDILVGKSDGYYLDVEEYGNGLKFFNERLEYCEDFDIIEVWKMKHKAATLSFDLDNRKIVWKEQEQKRNYIYIVDNNADPEFTIGTISVDGVFAKYEKAVEYIEKQGFEHLQDDIYVCEPYGQCVEIKMYEVQE